MRKSRLVGGLSAVAAAIAVGVAGAAVAQPSGYGPGMMYGNGPGGGYGPGYMGPGMMYGGGPGGGYGPGWMGPGMMYGYGGGGWGLQQQGNLNLTVDQVKNNMERWLAANGNPHVKLGNVAVKDADTITADIVTADKDALVQRYDINRHTGFTQPAS